MREEIDRIGIWSGDIEPMVIGHEQEDEFQGNWAEKYGRNNNIIIRLLTHVESFTK